MVEGLNGSVSMTEREFEILCAVGDSDDIPTAAEKLGLTSVGVTQSTARLRKKLGVKTNFQAYRLLTKGVRLVTTRESTVSIRLEEI